MNKNIIVSIIIVNYKVRDELFECIDSILKTKQNIELEIIVVDNSEKDEVKSDLKKKFPKVKYIKSKSNLGFGAGNNLGAESAKSEYLFFLNPDTKIIKGKISSLVKFIKNNKKVGAVAPQLLNDKNEVYDEQGARELTPKRAVTILSFINRLFPKNRFWKEYWKIPWDKKRVKNVDVIPGTAFMIKKELFEKIGGFDEKYFLYFEEFDLCKNLIKSGYKNYILPDLKLAHKWGASTKKNESSKKYFIQSRFYYFRKNYGLIKSLIVENLLRLNKESVIILGIIVLGLGLRIYNLSYAMQFLGDTAWFFIAARDILENGQLPLVGITSSHVWLHQGPYWSYILAIILKVFGFNPLNAGYFTIILDLLTLFSLYLFCKTFFNHKIAMLSALLYAISPFIIISAQIPYHTNPIPLLVILLLASILKWVRGERYYFPISIFLLAVLYNFQISSVPLFISFMVICAFGFIKRKKWFMKILNIRIFLISLLAFTVPMIPMLLFDIKNGFPQTLKVIIWIFYKIAVFFGYPPVNPAFADEPRRIFFEFVLLHLGRIYFVMNNYIGLILFIIFISIFIFGIIKSKYKDLSLNVVFIFFIIPAIAFLGMNSRSQAYLPMFYPTMIIIASYSITKILNKNKFIGGLIVLTILFVNVFGIINYPKSSVSLSLRTEAVKKMINEANGSAYNMVGEGPSSEFASFIYPYEYLAWYLGNPSSNTDEKIKFYITDRADTIVIRKQINIK